MKSHIANFVDIEFAEADRLARREIAQDIGAAAAQGTARSGRRWLALEEILTRNLQSFGERLSEKLPHSTLSIRQSALQISSWQQNLFEAFGRDAKKFTPSNADD